MIDGVAAGSRSYNRLVVKPFEPEHLNELRSIRNDARIFNLLNKPQYISLLSSHGGGFSAWVDYDYMGCAGVGQFPGCLPQVWMLATYVVDKHKLTFHRLVKRSFERIRAEKGYATVQAFVNDEDERACRWIERMGFEHRVTVCRIDMPFGLRIEEPYRIYVWGDK